MNTALVTLQEAKDYLKITSTAENALITTLILGASALCESYSNRIFSETTYAELYNGTGTSQLILDHCPIVDVHHFSIDIDVLTKAINSLVPDNEFLAEPEAAILELIDDNFGNGKRTAYVKYTAGYHDIPEDVKMAVKDLVSKKYNDIKDKRAGVYSKGIQGETITFSYKDITDSIRETLEHYRQPPGKSGMPAGSGWTVQS